MKKLILTISSTIFLASCSIDRFAARKTSEIIDRGNDSVFSDPNLQYIKESLPANLKLMEILIATDKNPKLIKNLSMGFCGYAFAFYDDNKEMANDFYLRGIKYSEEYIKNKNLKDKQKLNEVEFEILFWNTFCKSSYIDLNRDDLNALIYLNDIETQAEKLFKINPAYFYNSLYSILASVYASKPKMIGGDILKAKEYFEKAISGEGEKLLINKFIYAKIYPVLTDDEKLFDELTDEILNSKHKNIPEIMFFNNIAIIKTQKLKEKKNELF
ncbi:MAG: TRAP transporter TatT component family protein [Elusimicrobiota bacterium]